MLWVKLPVVDYNSPTYSSNMVVTGVENKATVDSKLNDGTVNGPQTATGI